jgi:hypothetical protein
MTRGRMTIVLVLVIGLLASAFARELAQSRRVAAAAGSVPAGAAGGIGRMNSFAIALLLGGLRGPLVMILWTSSEGQKADRELEDFDTKVEWIRLLQPEFDSVHIFQIWNKAYNISVQMASLANKYSTILDAIDYARSVDQERPDNINIISAIAGVYFDKLGNSAEAPYFRRRIREETLPRPERQRLQQADPGWRRIEHDVMLDENGNILPELLRPRHRRPADAGAEWNDGSELQYLEQYQPFPYGISAMGLGYNYFKRAQVMQSVGRQQHAQLSAMVIDSRPGLSLRFWSEDERERGQRAELRAFGMPQPLESRDPDRAALELPTAALDFDQQVADEGALRRAVFSYGFAGRLARDARQEYERHLRNHDLNLQVYLGHIDHVSVIERIAMADQAYLQALLNEGERRQASIAAASEGYRRAVNNATYVILRYYVDEEIMQQAFPPGYNRYNVNELPAEQQSQVLQRALRMSAQRGPWDPMAEDREEYLLHIERAQARLQQLQG